MKIRAKTMIRINNRYYLPGEEAEVTDRIAARLLKAGMATESATAKPPENAMMPKAAPKHLGGGWYEVRGEKVQGKEAAEAALKAQRK